MNASYVLGPGERNIGDTIRLVLESTNNGKCIVEYDTMFVTITSIPVVNAGIDDTLCANVEVNLNGSITGGDSTSIWSAIGFGSFIPDSNDLNATYIFSPVDTLAGNVSLILTSTNACLDISDTLNIEITPAPKVIAKIEQGICTNSDTVKLNSNIQEDFG